MAWGRPATTYSWELKTPVWGAWWGRLTDDLKLLKIRLGDVEAAQKKPGTD